MGRIIISAGHHNNDPGAIALGTTEAKEMMQTRDLLEKELDSRGADYLSVPDHLNLVQTINWINDRAIDDDVVVEIHGNAYNGSVRGASAYYIAGNDQRGEDAQQLLNQLLEAVPELDNRGAKPDTASGPGRLGICRDIAVPSVLMELCFIDNPQDLKLLQDHREKFVEGLAKGLCDWSNQSTDGPRDGDPTIDIKIKDRLYDEKGILVNNNSYIPMNLVENLRIPREKLSNFRKIEHGNVVYIKAVELQEFNFSVDWQSNPPTVIIKPVVPEGIDEIMRIGEASLTQLEQFLAKHNEAGLEQFSDLPKLYVEHSKAEGVNHDVAFCQMCLETGYLSFGGTVKPQQNNFCGLGAVDGNAAGASFPDAETGVKAHIQHLKAYGSKRQIKNPPIVDPRFDLVPRGVADKVYDLSERWALDPDYGKKIMTVIRQLHGIV